MTPSWRATARRPRRRRTARCDAHRRLTAPAPYSNARGLTPHVRHRMAIDVYRDRDRGMAEPFLDDLRIDVGASMWLAWLCRRPCSVTLHSFRNQLRRWRSGSSVLDTSIPRSPFRDRKLNDFNEGWLSGLRHDQFREAMPDCTGTGC